jgi:type II secretory pathway component GspD/PulD (secretin)
METIAEKSQFAGGSVPIFTDATTGNVITSPIKDITIAHSTVSIPNGQTIVMGGMITKTDNTLNRKVPWLGDLPLVGRAFRYDSTTTRRTELLIFLTPRVVKNDQDNELITGRSGANLLHRATGRSCPLLSAAGRRNTATPVPGDGVSPMIR